MSSTSWYGSEGPSRAGIEQLIALLPRLEARKPPFDEPHETNLFARIDSPELAELHQAIYDAGLVKEFDWPRWQREALRLFERLLEKGVLIRNVSNYPGLSRYLRITVGTAGENDELIGALGEVLE